MPNRVFDRLLLEQIEVFKNSFSGVSRTVFYDEQGNLTHPGEFGTYREAICKDFLRFFIPSRLDISQGFLINGNNEVSTQCDIIIYDSYSTPLIQTEERQRFFPVETVCAVGEVKSTLTKSELRAALAKLSNVKNMRDNINQPTILKRDHPGGYNPRHYPYDQVFTFLICQKLDLKLKNIFVDLYEFDVPQWRKHNLVLSLEDGLLLYYDANNVSLMYPIFNRDAHPKSRFIQPATNLIAHFKLFVTYMFLGTTSATILYPDMANYIGPLGESFQYDEQ